MTQTLLDKLEGLRTWDDDLRFDALIDKKEALDLVRNHQSSEASEITQALVSALRMPYPVGSNFYGGNRIDLVGYDEAIREWHRIRDEALAKYEALTREDK